MLGERFLGLLRINFHRASAPSTEPQNGYDPVNTTLTGIRRLDKHTKTRNKGGYKNSNLTDKLAENIMAEDGISLDIEKIKKNNYKIGGDTE